MKLRFVGVIQDKGGVGKSLFAANLWEWLQPQVEAHGWTLVEIEQRLEFTLKRYFDSPPILPLSLTTFNRETMRTIPSLSPLDDLFAVAKARRSMLVDFGASTFSLFSIWLDEHRAHVPLLKAGYEFTFFVVIPSGDPEAAEFFRTNLPFLLGLAPGRVVLVRNLRDGSDFSLAQAAGIPTVDLLQAEPPLSDEFYSGDRRRTFQGIAADENSSYRSRLDAEHILEHLRAQLVPLAPMLLNSTQNP